VSCCLACLAGRKESIHKQARFILQVIYREFRKGQAFSATRTCTEQDDTPNHIRMFDGELLRDHTPKGKAHDIEDLEIESAAECDDLSRHRFHRARRLAGRTPETWVIEKNDLAFSGETIRYRRIPIVHVGGEIVEHQQRNTSRLTKAPVSDLQAVDIDVSGPSTLVRDITHPRTV
jgi:hypothetical protein